MKQLSDTVVAKLEAEMRVPDLSGTRYTVVRYLARGGMGSVWLAEDTILQRRVALKVLDLVAPAADLADRLLREARILAALEHPGIVPVHDAGTLPDGRAFYCMKYVEGQTLAQHIAGRALLDRIALLQRIAEPLDFAHSRGFLHRDLKPENIMIGAFGEVLIMDWGLAKLGSASSPPEAKEFASALPSSQGSGRGTAQGRILGTPGYMSPEQARGGDVDRRTDIFSLGAILWFMLYGSPPGDWAAAAGAPRAIVPRDNFPRDEVPRALAAIGHKAMAVDPDARYASVGELASDLARYRDGSPVSAFREGLFQRAARIYARNRTAVILVVAYLLMRLLFILLARH